MSDSLNEEILKIEKDIDFDLELLHIDRAVFLDKKISLDKKNNIELNTLSKKHEDYLEVSKYILEGIRLDLYEDLSAVIASTIKSNTSMNAAICRFLYDIFIESMVMKRKIDKLEKLLGDSTKKGGRRRTMKNMSDK